mmetsp:Transcript_3059/g.4377  ORF Transcript_3059/g.4377 Transcript_3059/m.4377 type:complete len:500 (+) Transcript_3059:326-1825(+)|eukprot:CAMPEP_0203751668 /NCGR_PEP_ID=MMETSP0098-20131031/5695_1 /ASSEMBLY_ACC=CAM_ASM_000208 /TAXON_ID=96639 /ORGANISM=" , Strain NY0313808BC1" /LENGTH=499 /DNA_ID=CAMNT_0050641491 /DNA_START=579 /DNA_END=2078 /DNA_ORIENTATION=+
MGKALMASGLAAAGLLAAVGYRKMYGSKKATDNSIKAQMERLYTELPDVVKCQDELGIRLDPERFVELLTKLVGEAKYLQNFPPELVPQEDRAVKHVLEVLEPYMEKNGGVLKVETHAYTEGRSNVIIRYPGRSSDSGTISLIGSHLDVVPAVAENWKRDPFKLTVEGDKLYGRGTTDCLGHIALLTLFFEQLAMTTPELECSVIGVFIVSEECEDQPFIGIDGLERAGLLEPLKDGPCLWIDSSDSEPCMGTAGALQWHLKATGKRFHSGLPNCAVNPIELVSEACAEIQKRFYEEYPPHPEDHRYKFMNPSTMKPTQVQCAKGSLNQIPPTATISGDIRLSPFYDCKEAVQKVTGYVNEMVAERFKNLSVRGPVSRYELPKEDLLGGLEIEWSHEVGQEAQMSGVACDIDSPAFLAICDSIKNIRGGVNPYSVSGSLPLVFSMKEAGFDLQIIGFGRSEAYHAENEWCSLDDFVNATKILSLFCSKMDDHRRRKNNK